MTPFCDVIPVWAIHATAAAWGAIWGSFGNVVACRLPEGGSLVRPASHCPSCKTPIVWYDNIPVVSWVALRARCRHCGGRISPMYPFVELGSAALAVMAMRQVLASEPDGLPLLLSTFFVHFAFLWALLVLSVIDLRTMLLPDAITLPGIVVGLAYTLVAQREQALVNGLSVIGSYLGVWLLFVVGYRLAARREGMGMGDAKLLAMIAGLMGWKGALFSLVAGAFQGLLINLPALIRRHAEAGRATSGGEAEPAMAVMRMQIPFGPMLSLAAFEFFFWGDDILSAYFALVDRAVAGFMSG